MGLFSKFQKKKEPDLSKLDKDGNLPFGWLYANKNFVAEVSETLGSIDARIDSARKESLSIRIPLYKERIEAMKKIRAVAIRKGECFVKFVDGRCSEDDIMYLEDKVARMEEKENDAKWM